MPLLTTVSRISQVADHVDAISTTVSKSLRVGGAGHEVLIFDECIGTFASARKHLFFTRILKGAIEGYEGGPKAKLPYDFLETFVKKANLHKITLWLRGR